MPLEPWIDHDEGVRVIPHPDGSFTYEELTMPPEAPAAAARALGLSLKALAAEIGIHWTTLYRYTRGDAPIPLTVALAIECLLRRKGLFAG